MIPRSVELLALDSAFLGFFLIDQVHGHSALCGQVSLLSRAPGVCTKGSYGLWSNTKSRPGTHEVDPAFRFRFIGIGGGHDLLIQVKLRKKTGWQEAPGMS